MTTNSPAYMRAWRLNNSDRASEHSRRARLKKLASDPDYYKRKLREWRERRKR